MSTSLTRAGEANIKNVASMRSHRRNACSMTALNGRSVYAKSHAMIGDYIPNDVASIAV